MIIKETLPNMNSSYPLLILCKSSHFKEGFLEVRPPSVTPRGDSPILSLRSEKQANTISQACNEFDASKPKIEIIMIN